MKLKQIMLSTLLTCTMLISNQNVLYIGPGYGGMFASINSVLHDLLWCEQNNKIPVVFWDNRSHYYKRGGFNGSDNVWEYYFQPVAPINPRPSKIVPRPFWRAGKIYAQGLTDQETRNSAQRLIDKYIKLNPIVQEKVDNFYHTFMAGKKTVGIHLRGTDKHIEAKLVSPEEIILVALKATDDDDAQFLITSDERKLFEKMKKLLENRKVIFYDCYRSESGRPLHLQTSKPRCILGEDVVIEAMLLSKCDLLIHTMSCVSTGVLYFNAGLKSIRVDGY